MLKETLERVSEPTPKFFKKLMKIGGILTAIGGTIALAPLALPAAIVTAGGYCAFGGMLIAAISGTTSTKRTI